MAFSQSSPPRKQSNVPKVTKKAVPSATTPGMLDEITLRGRRVVVRSMDLPLDQVRLDPTNPRVANTVEMGRYGNGDELQQELGLLLWKDPDVQNLLYHSIRQNRGLIERIIVRSNGVAAEGNCRTVVYKRLAETFPDDPTWQTIPARVLPEDIDEKDIAILLGELHVGGKNEWSPFEKAGHIHALWERHGMTQDEIAKLLRTSKSAVNHSIRAFTVMKEKYLPMYGGVAAVRKFSHFVELFKKPELREWMDHDRRAIDDFVTWVGTEKIQQGADVRELGQIVKSELALQAFREQGYEAARRVLEVDQPQLASPLLRQMVDMTDALNGATLADIQKVRRDNVGSAKRIVRDMRDSLERFIDLCDGI